MKWLRKKIIDWLFGVDYISYEEIYKNYVETLKFLYDLGVKYVTCSGLILTGNATKEDSKATALSEDKLLQILKEAKKFTDEHLMEIAFTSPGWIKENKLRELKMQIPTCGACLSNMAIAPNGDVVPCQSWLGKDSSLGNILETKWKDIWDSPKCKKIRKYSTSSTGKCPLKEGGC